MPDIVGIIYVLCIIGWLYVLFHIALGRRRHKRFRGNNRG